MKTHPCPTAGQPTQPIWNSSSTAAPSWGTVSLSRQPVQALPQPAPGYHLQVLLRLGAGVVTKLPVSYRE